MQILPGNDICHQQYDAEHKAWLIQCLPKCGNGPGKAEPVEEKESL